MKVLLDFGNAGAMTGTGVYARALLAGILHAGRDGIEVEEAGISSVGNRLRPVRRLLYLARLERLRRMGYRDAEVVHFANVYAPRRRRGVAYVTTIHDLDAVLRPQFYTRRYSLYYGSTVAASIERSHIILTDTEAVRKEIIARYGILRDRVCVMGIGVNPQFAAAVEAARPAHHDDPPMLLYVGRLEAKKNTAWLINRVAHGVRTGALPHLRLVLAGGSSYGIEAIEQALRDAGPIAEWVVSPGLQDLGALYRRASCVVLPSHCEGFGIPLIEAMHCGKPIVASHIPTSVEVTGGSAHFFALDDADGFYAAVRDALAGVDSLRHQAIMKERLAHYAWPVLARVATDVYTLARHSR